MGQDFARWIGEPLDLVEVVVVELLLEWREGHLDVRVVDEPTRLRIDLARYLDLDAEAVPVEASALVAGWNLGEAVSGLELKRLDQAHHHHTPR